MAKILNVFYGADNLPYKDKDRSVHFPIVGSAFQGASDTTEIHFYFDRIGEPNTSWVAVSKLPNGKIGSKVLNVAEDSELNENYAILQLSSFYTQYKGDLYISLQGYQNGATFEYDEDDNIYKIYGTPIIQATGSVKLSIAYATQFVGSGEEENTDLQSLLALLGTKLNIANGIVILSNIATSDLSSYSSGQIIYDKYTKQYYVYDGATYDLAENESGLLGSDRTLVRYISELGAITLQELYDIVGFKQFILGYHSSYTGYTIDYLCQFQLSSGALYGLRAVRLSDLHSWYSTIVDTPLSSTFVTFISNTNRDDVVGTNAMETYVEEYTYDRNTIDTNIATYVSNYTYDKATIDAKDSTKVDKLTSPNTLPRVYGYEGTIQTSYATDNNNGDQMVFNALVKRNGTGQVRVPTTPTDNNHATSKKYTDDKFGVAIDLSIDSNYDLVVKLLNAAGTVLSSADIDLPLETIVVSAQYYASYTYGGQTYEKVIVIELATTSVPTIIPVGDILSGVVNESDIIDNLTSYDTDKPLSANQGRVLKALIDALESSKANASDVYTKNETYSQDQADSKFRTESQVDDQIDDKISGISSVNVIQDLEENKNYDYKFIVKSDGELIIRLTEIE